MESFTNPINLLYVDSTLSKKIIDLEFNSLLCEKEPDSVGIYRYFYPKITEKIAHDFNDRYAGVKLFEYYKKLPKFIKSDTIYGIYYNLDEFLSILVHYKPIGLVEKLKNDYYGWQNISKNAPSKNNPKNSEELAELCRNQTGKLNATALYPDCNLLAFQLASALKELNEPGFDDKMISELEKKHTSVYTKNYEFPKYFPGSFYSYPSNQIKIKLDRPYQNMNALLVDSSEFEKVFIKRNTDLGYGVINEIIYDNYAAYVSTTLTNGAVYFIYRLKGNTIIIEKIGLVIE